MATVRQGLDKVRDHIPQNVRRETAARLQRVLPPRFLAWILTGVSLYDTLPTVESSKPSATLKLQERVRELQRAGQQVFDLSVGESLLPPPPGVLEALQENVDKRGYPSAQGTKKLRDFAVSFYHRRMGLSFTAEQIIIGDGCKNLLNAAMVFGGSVIIPDPSWVSYEPMAAMRGKEVVPVQTSRRDSYKITSQQLEQAILQAWKQDRKHPPLLILNTTHNPTGLLYARDELQALAIVARRHHILVIEDAPYGDVVYEGQTYTSMRDSYPEGTLVATSLSKDINVPGWRVGIGIVPDGGYGKALMAKLKAIANHSWVGVNPVVQEAVAVAFDPDHAEAVDVHLRLNAAIHRARTLYLHKQLATLGLDCPTPQTAFYLYPDFGALRGPLSRHSVNTSAQLAEYMLERYHIAAVAGQAFGSPPQELVVRFSIPGLDAGNSDRARALFEKFRAEQARTGSYDFSDDFIARENPELVALVGALKKMREDLLPQQQ